MATESETANEDNLRLEHLRFTQIGEMVDAFMGKLVPGAGDVHLAMARWDLRRIARGTAAIHATDATGLKRLNDECEQAFTQIERNWFGK